VLSFQGVIEFYASLKRDNGQRATDNRLRETDRLAVRGLKTKIAWHVALLLLLSAVITDILVVLVMQTVILRHEVAAGRKRIESIGALFFSNSPSGSETNRFNQDIATTIILAQSDFPTLQIVDADGHSLYRQTSDPYSVDQFSGSIDTARRNGQTIIQEHRYAWHIFWWHPQIVSVVVPIFGQDRLAGVVAAIVPMRGIQESISQYHKPIFLYILINTVVLTIVGLYRIFRLYLRPIDRIVRQADDFHEDLDPFFAFRQEDNELHRLSSALNRMFSRISKDKKMLQETVMSLERANAELQNAQKEILRAEKMASVGRLAAGIAHEIGNPIGIVLGYLHMLKQDDLNDNDKLDFLKRTEDEVQRINTVIRQLLDLARPKTYQSQLVFIHFLIQDLVEVMRMQPVMKNINIELDLKAADDGIWGNDDQLRQVFLNLLLNAADAIQGGPNSDTGNVLVQTRIIAPAIDGQPPFIRIQVSDNGGGVDPEQLQNIFDPFYSTKEPGKGTGLGLAVSYMIIDRLGGTISALSEIGQGATFCIELPLCGKDSDQLSG